MRRLTVREKLNKANTGQSIKHADLLKIINYKQTADELLCNGSVKELKSIDAVNRYFRICN